MKRRTLVRWVDQPSSTPGGVVASTAPRPICAQVPGGTFALAARPFRLFVAAFNRRAIRV
jgi:hypothetical protein